MTSLGFRYRCYAERSSRHSSQVIAMTDRAVEIDAAFAAHGCPGVHKCGKVRPPAQTGGSVIYPCTDCKAPSSIMLQNPPTKVYRSYPDYCDD